jgi:hypothetical protein
MFDGFRFECAVLSGRVLPWFGQEGLLIYFDSSSASSSNMKRRYEIPSCRSR